jgi:hypothetical protein
MLALIKSYRSQQGLEAEDTFAALEPQIDALTAFYDHTRVED